MQKKQTTKLEQLKHLKASQERAKTRRGIEATKGFQARKGTNIKHPKQGRDTSYVSLHQIPTKDLHFSAMRHLNNLTFAFSSISTLRYLHIPTFGRQVIQGQHFHSSVIKANRVGRVISAAGHLNSSTFRLAGTSREVNHLYVRLPQGAPQVLD